MNSSTLFRRERLLAAALTGVAMTAYLTAFLVRFSSDLADVPPGALSQSVVVALVVKLAAILYFRLHQGWDRYVTFHDLKATVQAASCATVGLTLYDALFLPYVTIPRSVVVMDWGGTLLMLAGARAMPRLVREGIWSQFGRDQGIRAIIVGANDSGEAILRAIQRSNQLKYHAVGFVDDRRQLKGRRMAGVTVLGALDDLASLVSRHTVAEVLVNAGELPGKRLRQLIDLAEKSRFRVKVLPSYDQLLEGRVAVQPRGVNIADLLGRPSIELDDDHVRDWLKGRVVMVTGSSGSIGSEICRQLMRLGPERLLLVDRSETGQFFLERELARRETRPAITTIMADVTDVDRMRALFSENRPEIIFHAAAYKHVPLMEAHPGEAVKNIVIATRGLVDLSDEFGVEAFVMISTDKAVNPTSVMGSCKRLAERYVQAKTFHSQCRFVTVRFGNVLDSAGSVVPIFREQIACGGPVTVTHPEMVRFFMLIPEAAQLVIQAGAMGQGGEIFVLDMGEPVRIVDLANDMIRLSGLRVGHDIEIQFTGLRPGEKLYEELYGDEEQRQATPHPKILVASSPPHSLLETIYAIGRLEERLNGPTNAIVAELQQVVTAPASHAGERDPRRIRAQGRRAA